VFLVIVSVFPVIFYAMQYGIEANAKVANLVTSVTNDFTFAGISLSVVSIIQSILIMSGRDRKEAKELLGKCICYLLVAIMTLMLLLGVYDRISVIVLSGTQCGSTPLVISTMLFVVCATSCFQIARSTDFRSD